MIPSFNELSPIRQRSKVEGQAVYHVYIYRSIQLQFCNNLQSYVDVIYCSSSVSDSSTLYKYASLTYLLTYGQADLLFVGDFIKYTTSITSDLERTHHVSLHHNLR